VVGKRADDWFDPIPLDGESAEIDVTVAHIARVYNYWLGGKGNISQVVSGFPHSGRTAPIQALHACFSNIGLLAVR
jgi:hypothetical protein